MDAYFRQNAPANRQIVRFGSLPLNSPNSLVNYQSTTAATAVFNEAKPVAGKRVPASGTKFVGYGVRVMSGEKVVAEAYDPASLKESWEKAAVSPKQK